MNDLNTLIISEVLELITKDSSKKWFSDQVSNLSNDMGFFIAFGMVPKKLGKEPAIPSSNLLAELSLINPEFKRTHWSLDELARLALLMNLPMEGRQDAIIKLLAASDIRELKLIYKSIQYLQQAETFELQVVDGIRTNITDVYDAIALDSSYPRKYFKEGAWNQMVLKGIFMERPIYRISGLDERRNANLARIAIDFAHERQSAGRKVTPELWRLVVPFVNETILQDLVQVALSSDELERDAGIRAITESNLPSAHAWVEKTNTQADPRSWKAIGEAIYSTN